MSDRKSLFATLWLTFSLVLLGSAIVAPTRESGFFSLSNPTARISREFRLPPRHDPVRLHAAHGNDSVPQMIALNSEDEEQDQTDGLDPPRVSYRLADCYWKWPDCQSVVPLSIASFYPLRC